MMLYAHVYGTDLALCVSRFKPKEWGEDAAGAADRTRAGEEDGEEDGGSGEYVQRLYAVDISVSSCALFPVRL